MKQEQIKTLIDALAGTLEDKAQVRLRSIVQEIAWERGRDHAGVAAAYARTVAELEAVSAGAGAAGTTELWPAYVADAETAMSREHTSWIARRRRVPDPG